MVIVLQRKSCAVVMFKQESNFAPALAEADSRSDFSLMWEGFARRSYIPFNRDTTIYHRFQLVDISGTEIPVCGYADIDIATVGGEDFKQTRILIVAGTATTVILGRNDMKILKILGENFPLPMQQTSVNIEHQARAKTRTLKMKTMRQKLPTRVSPTSSPTFLHQSRLTR